MSITRDFANGLWYEKTSGAGSVVTGDSGSSVICKAIAADVGHTRYFTNALPGETLIFSVFARNRSADGFADFAAMWIDSPIDTLRNVELIESDIAQQYTVSYTVPDNLVGPVTVAFGVGVFTGRDGSAEYWEPRLAREGSDVVMTGFFECPIAAATIPFLREDYYNKGVGTATWQAGDKTLLIEPKDTWDFQESGADQFRPVVQVSGAPDGNTTEVYTWTGSCINLSGHIKISAASLTTDAVVDLEAAIGVKRFFGFTLYMA